MKVLLSKPLDFFIFFSRSALFCTPPYGVTVFFLFVIIAVLPAIAVPPAVTF